MLQLTRESGTVYLVGAGPGDPDLISVRGLKLLQQADALVYDRLVHPDLIDSAPAKTEKIYVGKAAARKSMPQPQINQLLVDLAQKYSTVVRLKGGDPFVFGRGSEEAMVLREAGVAFQVVPGISSAISIPAHAGIPVTHRGMAQSCSIVTGHTAGPDVDIEWEKQVQSDTLVILMGLRRLGHIASRLVQLGKSASTPVAVISRGSTVEQQTVLGTLENIADRAAGLPTPAIIVVGEVAQFHASLNWYRPHANEEREVFTSHIYAASA